MMWIHAAFPRKIFIIYGCWIYSRINSGFPSCNYGYTNIFPDYYERMEMISDWGSGIRYLKLLRVHQGAIVKEASN